MPSQQTRTSVLSQDRPLISFIIPVWNVSAEMFQHCIDSILQLHLSDAEREIIVVDDGNEDALTATFHHSTDREQQTAGHQPSTIQTFPSGICTCHPSDEINTTSETLQEISRRKKAAGTTSFPSEDTTLCSWKEIESRYHTHIVYLHQSHKGQSVARNTGIEKARGRFIQFVDADDWLEPSTYNHIIDLARRDKGDLILFHFRESQDPSSYHPICPYCSHSNRHHADKRENSHNPDDQPSEMTTVAYQDATIVSGPDWLCHHNMRASVCSYLFRRELLGDLRFNPQLIREDEEFTPLLMLNAQRLVETTAVAYIYRQHDGSVMHQKSKEKKEKAFQDIEHVIHHLNYRRALEKGKRREALYRRLCQLSMDHLYNVMRLTHSPQRLQKAADFLRDESLFPLPHRRFTLKYWLFSYITASAIGRAVLLRIL